MTTVQDAGQGKICNCSGRLRQIEVRAAQLRLGTNGTTRSSSDTALLPCAAGIHRYEFHLDSD